MTINESGPIATTRFSGEDQEFWDAVAAYNDPETDEIDAIHAALLLQQVLMLAQDALSKPDTNDDTMTVEGTERPSSSSQTRPAVVIPQKIIQRPKPGDVVGPERAVELFAESWVLRPVSPSKESTLSTLRDYRVFDGQLEYNSSQPPVWEASAGTISDCIEWIVICQQILPATPPSNGRTSRTSLRTTG